MNQVIRWILPYLNLITAISLKDRGKAILWGSISKIKKATPTGTNFHQNRDMAHFIKNMQTPFARYTPGYRDHLIEVIVEVDSSKAAFFKDKKHLLSQKIIEETTDGNLLISYVITQEREMEELIKKWIPHMKVISPQSLDAHIRKDIYGYLKG